MGLSWANPTQGTTPQRTGVLVVNTDSDTVIAFHEDERCDMAGDIVVDDNGDLYFGTTYSADLSSLRAGPLGCALRIKAGQDAFDPDYLFVYRDAGLPDVANILAPSPVPGHAYVTFLDESLADWSPESTDEFYSNVWHVYEIDLANKTSVRRAEEFGLSLNWLPTMEVDGEFYLSAGEGSGLFDLEYTLNRLSEGEMIPGVSAAGEIWQAARLR